MRMLGIWVVGFLLLAVSCKTLQDDRQGMRGTTGAQGEKGDRGQAGASCSSRQVDTGIEIKCDGQAPTILPFATAGEKGAAGKDGVSCAVSKTEDDGVTLKCPDKNNPAGFVEFKVTNGKNGSDGASCKVTYRGFGSTEITCGTSTFTVSDGAQGSRGPQGSQGPQGQPGDDGKDGQDSFSTTLSGATITDSISTGSPNIECKVNFISNDEEFRFRWLKTQVTLNGTIVARNEGRAGQFTGDVGQLRVLVPTNRSVVTAGNKLVCNFYLFAEQEYYAISLTQKIASGEAVVQDNGKVLATAADFDVTGPEYGTYGYAFTFVPKLTNLAPESECQVKISSYIYQTVTTPPTSGFFGNKESAYTFGSSSFNKPLSTQIINFPFSILDSAKSFHNIRMLCNGDTSRAIDSATSFRLPKKAE